MASKSKLKGDRFEREFVSILKEHNIPAKKIYLADQASRQIRGDVQFGANYDLFAELKHRENISKQLWEWSSGVDYLAIKRNNYKPLIIMDLDQFLNLMQKNENSS